MAKKSKKQQEALKKYDATKEYSLQEAIKVVKDITYTKFDASFDLDVRLGVDPRKANQMVKGVLLLFLMEQVKQKLFLSFVQRIKKKRLRLPELTMLVWMNTSPRLKAVGRMSM